MKLQSQNKIFDNKDVVVNPKKMPEDIKVIKKKDAPYPKALEQIHNPPHQLFIKGNLPDGPYFAVVGTRMPTDYGKYITPKIVEPLAKAGLTIVSGLAYGIDALAHKAALSASGKTIAVLGTGVDKKSLYPKAHQNLAEQIIKSGGAVISEYPPGTSGRPEHFPQRNRIIAGLSIGVLIIEAKEKSGALITANMALKENRDVFAIPGPITSSASFGPNRLIAQGAKLVTRAKDILNEYGIEDETEKENDSQKYQKLEPLENIILDKLESNGLHIDKLTKLTDIPINKLSAAIVSMELKGLVKKTASGIYIKN